MLSRPFQGLAQGGQAHGIVRPVHQHPAMTAKTAGKPRLAKHLRTQVGVKLPAPSLGQSTVGQGRQSGVVQLIRRLGGQGGGTQEHRP